MRILLYIIGLTVGCFGLIGDGQASVPEDVRPSIAPLDIQKQYEAWRVKKAQTVANLACLEFWEDAALLCFRRVEGPKRVWVTHADLRVWGTSLNGLAEELQRRAVKQVAGQVKDVPVNGMDTTYVMASNQDGWGASLVLAPGQMAERWPGREMLFSVPAHGIILAWPGGNPDLDKVMAVGSREIYDSKPGSVSPIVFRWTKKGWVPFVEAKPSSESGKMKNPPKGEGE